MATLTEARLRIDALAWRLNADAAPSGPTLEIDLTTFDASGAMIRQVRLTTVPGRLPGIEQAIGSPAGLAPFLAALEVLARATLGIG